MTPIIHKLKNNFCDSIIIAKIIWNSTFTFLRYGIESKMGVILRRKVATYNEQMSKLPRVSLFQIYSALCVCQILFELIYSWESYHNSQK